MKRIIFVLAFLFTSVFNAMPASAKPEYTTPPILEVIGSGKYAKLNANISNGQITSINIISGGKGYSKNNTTIRVSPRGSGAIFNAEIQKWSINAVEKYKKYFRNRTI